MSDWETLLADANADLQSEIGISATWTPTSGASSDVNVVLIQSVEMLNADTGQYEARDVVMVDSVDISQPRFGDVVTIDGVSRSVDRYQQDYGFWRCIMKRIYS